MAQINDFFYITVSEDKMLAEIHCKKAYDHAIQQFESPMLLQFLRENKIVYGIDKHALELLLTEASSDKFPMIVAKGIHPQNGNDGKLTFKQDYSSKLSRNDQQHFRDVMRIPSVKKGDELAVISLPTVGQDGMNVHGKVLRARPGQPISIKAGKDVIFIEKDYTFYANAEGEMKVTSRFIQIDDVYIVDETLSMKTGNVDFIGSVIIKGDVPSGYTVKAAGDIKIHGIVEAATIISGGSVYISEGLSGLKKGYINAVEDIHIGYINQGIVEAGKSIYVENSIIHSECVAKERILCQRGNIIGGSLSVGKSIEARDIGNRLSTETIINLGLNKALSDEQTTLEKRKEKLTTTLKQLEAIGKKFAESQTALDAKMRITVLRQRRSYEKVLEEIELIHAKLDQMNIHLGSKEQAHLVVRNDLHPHVIISFGKYKRVINKPRRNVQLKLNNSDIVIHALNK